MALQAWRTGVLMPCETSSHVSAANVEGMMPGTDTKQSKNQLILVLTTACHETSREQVRMGYTGGNLVVDNAEIANSNLQALSSALGRKPLKDCSRLQKDTYKNPSFLPGPQILAEELHEKGYEHGDERNTYSQAIHGDYGFWCCELWITVSENLLAFGNEILLSTHNDLKLTRHPEASTIQGDDAGVAYKARREGLSRHVELASEVCQVINSNLLALGQALAPQVPIDDFPLDPSRDGPLGTVGTEEALRSKPLAFYRSFRPRPRKTALGGLPANCNLRSAVADGSMIPINGYRPVCDHSVIINANIINLAKALAKEDTTVTTVPSRAQELVEEEEAAAEAGCMCVVA